MSAEFQQEERFITMGELQTAVQPASVEKETLIQDYFQPCRDAEKVYELHKLDLKKRKRFRKGELIPLDGDQESLKKIFLDGNENLKFSGPIDVYNITKPFQSGGETFIAARIEPRDLNFHAKTVFFKKTGGEWVIQNSTFNLEDPFVTTIKGELVFGGVETFRDEKGNFTGLQTVFFRGKTIEDLKEFARGPVGQKDIRLVEMKDGKIGVFTRPQRGEYGKGQIGFTVIDSLEQLNEKTIEDAPLLSKRFLPGEWGGVNEAVLLEDGSILAVAHRSYEDSDGRHYFGWLFIYYPESGMVKDLGIVTSTGDFPDCPARAEDLKFVFFSGGIEKAGNGYIYLYGGIRDAKPGRRLIPDPLKTI